MDEVGTTSGGIDNDEGRPGVATDEGNLDELEALQDAFELGDFSGILQKP
jgi:hypothetical protein